MALLTLSMKNIKHYYNWKRLEKKNLPLDVLDTTFRTTHNTPQMPDSVKYIDRSRNWIVPVTTLSVGHTTHVRSLYHLCNQFVKISPMKWEHQACFKIKQMIDRCRHVGAVPWTEGRSNAWSFINSFSAFGKLVGALSAYNSVPFYADFFILINCMQLFLGNKGHNSEGTLCHSELGP